MEEHLFDSEMRLMGFLWEEGPLSAKALSLLAGERYGWNKNTTYTVLTRLVNKGRVERQDPGFFCRALVSREQVQRSETKGLLNRFFGGSKKALFSALLEDESLTQEEWDALKQMIEDH
ncbi:MAG: BlaI/MecI/CopY family transcriptional regulator [Lachnospiraceae bacterium]|nr:BlaI/MecI/CopY family transcriptional regulator [Lachnospiraceae bacterium]